MPSKSKIGDLINKLGIDETYTKPTKKPKQFTHVKDNIPLVENYNFMADLLFLPETKEGFKFCLVVVDLSNDDFDIEPIKNKTPSEILKAMKDMFKRKFIKEPYASIQTDAGGEFKGVFAKWMYDESILHKTALPDRHSQMSNVESLNKQLGRIFNGYLNKIEEQTGKSYNQWTDIISTVRTELNKIRDKKLPKNWVAHKYKQFDTNTKPKYKVGDVVYRQLDAPKNALGHAQPTKNFRMGDYRFDVKEPKKITQVLYYSGAIPYRYMLEGIPNASYTEAQLMLAKDQTESKFTVKKIIGKKTENKKVYYLIWWQKYLKKEATWEPKTQLEEDGLTELIKEYEKDSKK